MFQNDCIQNLMDLGLTLVQARVYLSLSKLDCAPIKAISKTSSLARQDVYRIMPSLEKLGLVEKVIDKPTRYKATPIKNGFATLLQQRMFQDSELQKKTAELLKCLHENTTKTENIDEEPQFVITSEISLLFKKLMKSTEDAQVCIDTLGNWPSFEGVVLGGFPELKKALQRGVKIHSITEKPTDEKAVYRYVKAFKKYPSYDLRYISAPVPATFVIIDKKELNIGISNHAVSSLWSNNPAIVGLAVNYFENLWQGALKDKTKADEIINGIATSS